MIADLVPAEQIIDIGRQAHMQVFFKNTSPSKWRDGTSWQICFFIISSLVTWELAPICYVLVPDRGTGPRQHSLEERWETPTGVCLVCVSHLCTCFLNTCPLFHLNTWPSITWSPDRSITCAPFSQSPAIISPEEPPAPFLSWPNINFYALP